MQKGTINVQTENIFPIIKKFLYSDHEIFLRELVSNAVDATTKLKALSSLDKVKDELGDLTIEIAIDKEKKTITFSDQGIGMTADEIDKYINQIAFSGAEEFLKKYKGKTEVEQSGLIGHFGLGFYSAFMVAEKVEINTKTYKKGAGTKAVRWSCDGSPEYTLSDSDKTTRGTDITLHVGADSEEFLEENRILGLLNKYCKFLPVPIRFGNTTVWEKSETEKDEKGEPKEVSVEKPRIINNTNPLWKQKPVDLKDDDYNSFYRELYPMNFEDPLFHIHLNVDYPFNLTGILYFPKVKRNFEVQRDKIQLYCNQVFVTDSVEGIVPDFLTLLHGVIDSPDIPLNVSRSYLQSDQNVKKISGHIMKKVADKLEEIYRNNKEDFEKKWDDIRIFIQYGMISEPKFYERAEKFCLLKNLKGNSYTFNEYRDFIAPAQTDKEGNVVYLYTTNKTEQHSFIEAAENRGYDILVLDGPIDNHFVNALEQKLEKSKFLRVDSDTIDNLIKKEDSQPSKLSDDEKNKLKAYFEEILDKDKYHVLVENLSENDLPLIVTQPEFMRRMREMSQTGGGYDFMGTLPETYNMVINANHRLTTEVLNAEEKVIRESLMKQLVDLALLSQNLLKGEALTGFIRRSVDLIK